MLNQQPLVSVVIPCYNHERYVKDCIQSVIDQTYQNIELIIIDDGSKDNSVAEIQKMVDKCKERFTRFEFRYRANVGLSATLNEALDWCQGKYFSAIASDDQMLPHKTVLQVEFLEKNSDYVAVFGEMNQIDENNNIERTWRVYDSEYNFDDIAKLMHYLYAPTQLIRLENLLSVGGYNPKLRIEDWYSYLKLTKNGMKMFALDNIVCNYRRHTHNTSKNVSVIVEKIDVIKSLNLLPSEEDKYISYIYLAIAQDFSFTYKTNAIKYFFKAILTTPKILFTKRAIKILLKIFIPSVLVKKYL